MEFFHDFFYSKIFLAPFLGWLIAQLLKTIIHTIVTKQFLTERLTGSGGMPSSHSSAVCAFATAAGILYGGSSYEFVMATLFAIIIMHDASGVRREAGNHAKLLNELYATFLNNDPTLTPRQRLKEFVGHTPIQVLAGAILGIILGFIVCA
ncbi:MAG: divergent PAP2 family protein [Eubacteriales bacterium]